MIQRYRIYGMIVCLIFMLVAGTMLVVFSDEQLHELAALLTMFVGGYGLRETLDHLGESENAKENKRF